MRNFYKISGIGIGVFCLVIVIVIIAGCKKKESTPDPNAPVDYSVRANWISIPLVSYKTDVFYVYPTVWLPSTADTMYCAINNPQMVMAAPQLFDQQATAFDAANIFAPYYRQANAYMVLDSNLSWDQKESIIGGIPTQDVTGAFKYYIEHFNNNRPFILAGHSQGADVLTHLLAGYLKNNPQVYKRMIAAYIIGTPVTKDFLKSDTTLKFAAGPDDLGVIISYNTEAPGVTQRNPVIGKQIGMVINPINWKTDETYAGKSAGFGSYMVIDPVTKIWGWNPQYADSQVDTAKGILLCTTADPAKYSTFGINGIYHGFDYAFYYYNLRENARTRIINYLKANPGK